MKKTSISISLEDEQMARHIALVVQKASKYESAVYIQSGERKVNAKSIMGMMTLGLDICEELEISVEGSDEDEAMEGISSFIKAIAEQA